MAHRIEIEHEHYLREQPGRTDETVDAAHVERFLNAASFFDGLVESPEIHEIDEAGVITVTQTTPEGDTRITTFTPLCADCMPEEG